MDACTQQWQLHRTSSCCRADPQCHSGART
jgi:hypothetical protein